MNILNSEKNIKERNLSDKSSDSYAIDVSEELYNLTNKNIKKNELKKKLPINTPIINSYFKWIRNEKIIINNELKFIKINNEQKGIKALTSRNEEFKEKNKSQSIGVLLSNNNNKYKFIDEGEIMTDRIILPNIKENNNREKKNICDNLYNNFKKCC